MGGGTENLVEEIFCPGLKGDLIDELKVSPSCKREMPSGEAETCQFEEHHNIRYCEHQSERARDVERDGDG